MKMYRRRGYAPEIGAVPRASMFVCHARGGHVTRWPRERFSTRTCPTSPLLHSPIPSLPPPARDRCQAEDVGIITPYSAQVRLLQDVVGSSRRSAAAAAPAAESTRGGEWVRQEEGGAYYGGNGGGGGAGGKGRRGGRKRGGIGLPEIASVDGYQGREKEVRTTLPFVLVLLVLRNCCFVVLRIAIFLLAGLAVFDCCGRVCCFCFVLWRCRYKHVYVFLEK